MVKENELRLVKAQPKLVITPFSLDKPPRVPRVFHSFDRAIIYAGLDRGGLFSSSKKAEATAILFTLRKANEFQLDQLLILTDFLLSCPCN